MIHVSFTIPGSPVGKGRPRFARRGKKVVTYTPEETASYENLVKLYASLAMKGRAAIGGAVAVSIGLFLTPPASWSKKKQADALNGGIFPTSKPDLDNCIKGIFDACNEIIWLDDKQAVDLSVRKRYSIVARAIVEITEL